MRHHDPSIRSTSIRASNHEVIRTLVAPASPRGVALFVHAGGQTPHDQAIVQAVQARGVATLRLDLVGAGDAGDTVEQVADRIVDAIDWVRADPELSQVPLGLFGGGRSAAATLLAAARRPREVAAVVCSDGELELARDALPRVRAAALFLVGGLDAAAVALHRDAAARLATPATLSVVASAHRILDEPGAADEATHLTANWFASQFQIAFEAASRRGLGDPDC